MKPVEHTLVMIAEENESDQGVIVPGVTISDSPIVEYHPGSLSWGTHVGIPWWYSTMVCPLQNASVEIAAGL